jgi:hypothetical protein
MNLNGYGRTLSCFNLRPYPGMCLEGLRKIHRDLSKDSRFPSRDFNPNIPTEHKARVVLIGTSSCHGLLDAHDTSDTPRYAYARFAIDKLEVGLL